MRPRRYTSILPIVAVFANLSMGPGCSLALVDGPPPELARRRGPLNCTTTVGWPVVDTLLAGWLMLNLGINAGKDAREFQGGADAQASAMAVGFALSALTVASAITGYSRVSNCKDALAEEDATWSPSPRRSRAVPRPVVPPGVPAAFPEAPFGSPGAEAPPTAVGAPSGPAPAQGPGSAAPVDAGASPARTGGAPANPGNTNQAAPATLPPPTAPPTAPPAAPPVRQMRDNE